MVAVGICVRFILVSGSGKLAILGWVCLGSRFVRGRNGLGISDFMRRVQVVVGLGISGVGTIGWWPILIASRRSLSLCYKLRLTPSSFIMRSAPERHASKGSKSVVFM